MRTSTSISNACSRAASSMVGSFPSVECESQQCKREGLAAHLVQTPSTFHVPAHPGLVLLAAEPTKDVHDGAFGGFFKSTQGDVLGLGQQGFGFSHFSSLMDVSK